MRRSLRIKKRRELREKRRQEASRHYVYDEVFSFKHLCDSFRKCLKGVRWKRSVQEYKANAIVNLYKTYTALRKRRIPKPRSGKEILIYERGKKRIITPIHIFDRVYQKTLCDYCLTPLLSRHLIYDNGASLEGKGVSFARKRLEEHLRNALKEYGKGFYVLSFDFKNYFDSVPHETCRMLLERYIADPDIVNITMQVIKAPYKGRSNGICLGSQVSQTMALIVANDLDHLIKDKLGVKCYERYMDDGIAFLRTKEDAQKVLDAAKDVLSSLGLEFNEKKTHIVPVSQGFTFLKVKYNIASDGCIIKRLTHKSIVRMRRKLKKFRDRVNCGKMTLKNVYDSVQSWLAHSRVAKSHRSVKCMTKTYKRLYPDWSKDVLQTDKWAMYHWRCDAG